MRPRGLGVVLLAVAALAGCAPRSVPPYGPEPLVRTVRAALSNDPGRDFYRDRERLAAMGPELDPLLLGLALDRRQRTITRANAVLLLADRGVEAAIPSLRILLLADDDEAVRAAAVSALYRFADDEGARNALRAAVGDRSRRVRLGALQGLDMHDTGSLRAVLGHEPDAQVRSIAAELAAMAEARGAPLQEGAEGLATVALEGQPRLLFRAGEGDAGAHARRGEVWLLREGEEPRLLATGVEVVREVLPAFFSADRSLVVLERDREIWIQPVEGGPARRVGSGVAPRPIPFSPYFAFLRERPEERRESGPGWELTYDVWRGSFAEPGLELLGELRAAARLDRAGGASPVRWMRVRDLPEGFLLHGDGMQPFALPYPEAAGP
jgi:hypothetical protein